MKVYFSDKCFGGIVNELLSLEDRLFYDDYGVVEKK